MPSEKVLLHALDLLTVAPAGEVESLTMGGTERVKHARSLVDQDNIVAVGISEKISGAEKTGALALTFYVDKKLPLSSLSATETVPPALSLDLNVAESILTDVVEIGQPKLEMAPLMPRAQHQPIRPGFSIGHYLITAGTLGAIVRRGTRYYLLSNSHVLANSGLAQKGDKILYPGTADQGKLNADVIAELEEFVVFQMGGAMVNRADCAIASILPEKISQVFADIEDLGLPNGTVKPKRGMIVTKSGRTTHTTEAEVRDVNFRMIIKYTDEAENEIGKVGFLDQVFCTRYTDGGDSGALVLEKKTRKAVGLHFAGYPDDHGVKGSVFNPISEVLKALKVRLVTKPLTS